MARERAVTRTINVLSASALCVEVSTATTKTLVLELTGVGEMTSEQILKALRKQYETDDLKVVSIMATEKREELYGMSEIDFLKYAHRLDPQTRKALAVEPTETSDEVTTYVFPSDEETDAPKEDAPVEPKKSKKGGKK